MWGIHRSPVNSPHKGQWHGALMFALICVWTNDWVKNREAGDLRRYIAHYDVTVMFYCYRNSRVSVRVPVNKSSAIWVNLTCFTNLDMSQKVRGVRTIHSTRCISRLHIVHISILFQNTTELPMYANTKYITATSNENHDVSNYRSIECLFTRLFTLTTKNIKGPHYCPLLRWIPCERWVSRTKEQ